MQPKVIIQEVKGRQDMLEQISLLGKVPARKLTREVLRDIMKPTFATAKQLVPVDKGALAASLKLRAIARTRRGIGVLITSTGALTKSAGRRHAQFSGDQFYGSFVEWGHYYGRRSKEIKKFERRLLRDYRRGEISPLQRTVFRAEKRGAAAAKFPGIPFLKDAGEMHRARMDREFIEKMRAGIYEALTNGTAG